ncbi:hypothetical protein [Rhizobacter sp. OV335]|jgi:hypothetical protein|uniref:hypothetical protein n=1 Tax=Rhizobacter sp. OV335 TaxID=1500264 RepID=UPI00091991CC|nr:hypothetical protein [Rhizobacter sp. OV335]SHM00786.1 hypothetical protein SAMN02787076_00322 [Rhizobacter sp. OV335]
MSAPESSTAEVAKLLHRLWMRVSRGDTGYGDDMQDTVVDPDREFGFADTEVEDRFRFGPTYGLN